MPDYDWDYPEEAINFDPLPLLPEPVFDAPLEVTPNEVFDTWLDSEPGGSSAGMPNWTALAAALAQGGSAASSVLKALGLVKGDGSLDLLGLTTLLGGIGGTRNLSNAQGKASEELQAAAKAANEQALGLIGGARDAYAPYMAAGTSALGQMQGMIGKPLAAQFHSQGPTSNAASKFRGGMTLAELTKR